MALLLPFLFYDCAVKIRAFVRRVDLLTSLGFVNVCVFGVLFYTLGTAVIPATDALKEPLTLKGKALSAAEDKMYDDLYSVSVRMAVLNVLLLVLSLVQCQLKHAKPVKAKAA